MSTPSTEGPPPPPPPAPDPGVAVVTGATSGLGREIALEIAARGRAVVVVGRGADRAEAVAKEVGRVTGNPRVEWIGVADLSRPSEVRKLAAEILARYPRVSLLVNNAGAIFRRREVTTDGLERTFALNVLAPFLLTELLADRLRASAPARVVNVASAAHYRHRINFADLQSQQHYSGYAVYGTSKLELILLTREFARRFAGSGVTVNAVHPGFVASGFGQNNGGGFAFTVRVVGRLFGRSLARGADTPVFVATDPSVATVTGEYFSDRVVHAGDPASRDTRAASALFDQVGAIASAAPASA